MDIETFEGVNIDGYFLNLWRTSLVYAVARRHLKPARAGVTRCDDHDITARPTTGVTPATPPDRRVNSCNNYFAASCDTSSRPARGGGVQF